MAVTTPAWALAHIVDPVTKKTTFPYDVEIDGSTTIAATVINGFTATPTNAVGNGSSITQTQTALTTGFNSTLYLTKNFTPSIAGNSSQALATDLVSTGDGTLYTGPSIAAVEMRHLYSATGTAGAILYGAESLFSQDGTGTVANATGFQSNIRGTGAGTVTTFSCFRASPGPFTASGTSMICYTCGLDMSGSGTFTNVVGYDSRSILKNTNDGTNVTGGAVVVAMWAPVPTQGANTSGSNNNYAFRSSNNSGHGGGQAGINGTVNNYVFNAVMPDAAAIGSGTGHTRNLGFFLTGNGGTGASGNGGVTNWALMSQSLAQSGFAGPVGIGAIVSSALIDTGLAADTTLTVKPQVATTGSPVGILYTGAVHTTLTSAETVDAYFNLARTVQFTGNTTLATQRAFRIAAPTYSSDTATMAITTVATFDIQGAPSAGTNVSSGTVVALRVNPTGTVLNNIAGTVMNVISVPTATAATLAATTQVTSTVGFSAVSLGIQTINQSGGAVTVDQVATLNVVGPPAAGASVTLTTIWSVLVQAGSSKFGGAVVQGHATAAINSTNTATAAQAATGYITSTSAAPTTITLPTGTALGAAIGAVQGTIFELFIDNTAGSNTVTVAVNTNAILSAEAAAVGASAGLLTVPSGVTGQARFTLMFSSATAYTFTRTA